MKRIITILLTIILIVSFSCCADPQSEFKEASRFYYLTKDISYGTENGVIAFEEQETAHIRDDLTALIQQYLNGPSDPQLYNSIHSAVTVDSVSIVEDTVIVTFSPEFALLSDIDLTLACSCVALTLMDYTEADTVQFFAEDEILGDNGRIMMTRDKLLLIDQQPTTDDTD